MKKFSIIFIVLITLVFMFGCSPNTDRPGEELKPDVEQPSNPAEVPQIPDEIPQSEPVSFDVPSWLAGQTYRFTAPTSGATLTVTGTVDDVSITSQSTTERYNIGSIKKTVEDRGVVLESGGEGYTFVINYVDYVRTSEELIESHWIISFTHAESSNNAPESLNVNINLQRNSYTADGMTYHSNEKANNFKCTKV